MPNGFESITAGVAAHIGNYADAVRVPAGVDVIYTSGTRACARMERSPRISARRLRRRGATFMRCSVAQGPTSATSLVCGNG